MILGLSLISYWRFKNFQEAWPEIELPKLEMPEIKLENLLFPEKEGYREWISPDGKLKLKYSANWLKMDKAFLGQLGQVKTVLVEMEFLFFAYQFKIKEQALASLIVGEITPKKSLEEIKKEIEENIKREGGEIKITILEIKDEKVKLEMVSRHPGRPNFFSKGKIVFGDDKNYLIFITTPEKDWPKFEKEVEKIFKSVQFTF